MRVVYPFSIALMALLLIPIIRPACQMASPEDTLRIGITHSPPMSMLQDGEWTGISVDIWNELSRDLGYKYVYEPRTVHELLDGLENGELDLGFGALSITAEREESIDFSFPYFSTSLGIATMRDLGTFNLFGALGSFFSWAVLRAFAAIMALLLISGALIWFFERHENHDMFGKTPIHGLGNGIWWAVVTLTTVGYGDKAPKTVGGRIVAIVWMFSSTIVLAGFTGIVAGRMAVAQYEQNVYGFDDLAKARVGVVGETYAAAYIKAKGFQATPFNTVEDALDAMEDGVLDAVVHDKIILQYLVAQEEEAEVIVLPESFRHQFYGMAMPEENLLSEDINFELVRISNREAYIERLRAKYLGSITH